MKNQVIRRILMLASLSSWSCTASDGNKNAQTRQTTTITSSSSNAASFYSEAYLDLGNLDDSFSGKTISLATLYQKTTTLLSFSVPDRPTRSAEEARNPYAYMRESPANCNNPQPWHWVISVTDSQSGSLLKEFEMELKAADCGDAAHYLCLSFEGTLSQAKVIRKSQAFQNAPTGESPTPIDGTPSPSTGTAQADSPNTNEPQIQADSQGQATTTKSRAEIRKINCRS